MNQQKLKFICNCEKIVAKAEVGLYTKIDLGIAKCNFEFGANKKFDWTSKKTIRFG